MIPQFQFRRCIFFVCLVSLTTLMIFCYNYSNEFTANLIQPYIQKQIQNLDLKKFQSISETQEELNEDQQNNLPKMGNLMRNSEVMSFFKNMIGKNFDFFVKLKDMQMRNVSFSEAGEDELEIIDSLAKSENQLPLAPNLIKILEESSKMEPIKSNDIESTINPIFQNSSLIQINPNLQFLRKVSEIYPPGFLYSPSSICYNNLQLLIIVTSAPANFEARNAIRKTWGQFNSTNPVKLLFIVGSSIPKNEKKLNEENAAHADLIHGHFVDSYNNLTLKTISMLEWVKKNCKSAKFILKADDDTFINVNKLLELTESRINDTKSIYGCVRKGGHPFRDPKSKYFISYDEFADFVYPDFTSGPAYLITNDCAELIYNEVMDQKYLKLEDVFITGIIASRLRIQRIKLKEFLNEKPGRIDACLLRKLVSVHYISPKEQVKLWNEFNDENNKC